MEISPSIIEKIKGGEAVLFLGAGASIGATNNKGASIPIGSELRDNICDKYLKGDLKERSLKRVADIAKNENSIIEVQKFIREQFIDFYPAKFHELIPSFRWKAIVTTNFDLIIERAYDNVKKPLQNLVVISKDGENLNEKLKNNNNVKLIKAHGCINDYGYDAAPMIIASEEYSKYRQQRASLFAHIKELGMNYPFIFCGYGLDDSNINEILFDLYDQGVKRPYYAIVSPKPTEYDKRLWSSHRFNVLEGTFEEFLNKIDSEISKNDRFLSYWLKDYSHQIEKYIKPGVSLSPEAFKYIDEEFDLVDNCDKDEGVDPWSFYRGEHKGWGGIIQDLDIKRKVSDDILQDSILDSDTDRVKVYLLKGYAGSGKSITMKRIAWEAHHTFNACTLFLKEGGSIRSDLLLEISRNLNCTLNIFLGDVFKKNAILKDYISQIRKLGHDVNIFIEARTNEWNIYGDNLAPLVAKEYELRNLSTSNIVELIDKLESHNCLGYLESVPKDERLEYCEKVAKKQLLVALYEITSGKPFEEIVLSEFHNISPRESRMLYLDICTLHRLNIEVRAGVLSRISGLSLVDFRENLFKPLEHLVFDYFDHFRGDYAFRARHSEIAAIVYDKGISTQGDRASQLLRIINCLNLDYDSDNKAFSELIKGRNLSNYFGDKNYVDNIFSSVESQFGELSFVLHQRAVFELAHTSGDLKKGLSFINKAINSSHKKEFSMLHTKANILAQLSERSSENILREKYRAESLAVLAENIEIANNPRFYVTYVQLLISELVEKMEKAERDRGTDTDKDKDKDKDSLTVRAVVECCDQIEDLLTKALQKFQDDEYLTEQQSRYKKIINEDRKADQIVKRALIKNPASEFLAIRVAEISARDKDYSSAIGIIEDALQHNRNSKILNYNMARYLSLKDEQNNRDDVIKYLSKSFTDGDSNYRAQFWYARHCYLAGDKVNSSRVFNNLKNSRLSPQIRQKIMGETGEQYIGKIINLHDNFCFVSASDLDDSIFVHYSTFSDQDTWNSLYVGAQINFELAFTMLGPCGANCSLFKDGKSQISLFEQ